MCKVPLAVAVNGDDVLIVDDPDFVPGSGSLHQVRLLKFSRPYLQHVGSSDKLCPTVGRVHVHGLAIGGQTAFVLLRDNSKQTASVLALDAATLAPRGEVLTFSCDEYNMRGVAATPKLVLLADAQINSLHWYTHQGKLLRVLQLRNDGPVRNISNMSNGMIVVQTPRTVDMLTMDGEVVDRLNAISITRPFHGECISGILVVKDAVYVQDGINNRVTRVGCACLGRPSN
jgi:hypothetical protein